jgi:hypothetical protein
MFSLVAILQIKFLDEVPLKEPIEEFLASGTSGPDWNPAPQLQTLNIILSKKLKFRLG